MRVLIVYEKSHRAYGETLEGAIRGLRPQAEARVIHSRELEAEVSSFNPHLVVSSQTNTVEPGGPRGLRSPRSRRSLLSSALMESVQG